MSAARNATHEDEVTPGPRRGDSGHGLGGCGSTTEADQLALLGGGTVTIDVIDE